MDSEVLHQVVLALVRHVHFGDEDKRGHGVAFQKAPERLRVGLDAVRAADDKDGVIQYLEGSFHLPGEVCVARCVKQGQLHLRRFQDRLLEKDGDAPGSLQFVGVQIGVPVVHPPQFFDFSREIQHALGQGGFSSVHVGQNAGYEFLHSDLPSVCVCPIITASRYDCTKKGSPKGALVILPARPPPARGEWAA